MTTTNRLIHESSPYLRQHAHNPVDWFPWGEEAFAKARTENKPIFLSIGYSTCHWCHVMERESFEHEELAGLLNQHFVAIKVDREERPDLDRLYMTAVQATMGHGGWPMSVWLTPELKPFFCGTYFPRQQFAQLLQRIVDVWETNRDGVIQQADQITGSLAQYLSAARETVEAQPLPDERPLHTGFEQLKASYDRDCGGFGHAPKFPHPVSLDFLFHFHARTGESAARDMALHQLRAMARGGIVDQLGGGFHRYSVDSRWLVSHFEKMLYDQAQLICRYVEAWQLTGDNFYTDIARRTAEYVLRDLSSPEGGFYSAEDADSEGEEGKFYVWTRAEIQQVLGDNAEAFCRAYGVTEPGNWEHGNNVLHVVEPGNFAAERAALFAVREKRIRPHRDEKILTAWNGLMISALARLGLPAPAEKAARYLLAHHYREDRLWRTPNIAAMLDDYAFFANGLLDLHEATFDPVWLTRANELAGQMLELFYDTEQGGFFQTDGRDASVIIRSKDNYDGAEPAGNSVATTLLLRLAEFTGEQRYRAAAEKTLAFFAGHLRNAPHAMPAMLCNVDWVLSSPRQVTIAGKEGAEALLGVVRAIYAPNQILKRAPSEAKATAQVCVNHACQLPVAEPAELRAQLAGSI